MQEKTETSFLVKSKKLLLKKLNVIPHIAIITGSGVKVFNKDNPLSQVSGLESNVKGHEGTLKLYKIKGKYILVFSGRKHLYEGLSINEVVAGVKLTHELGIKKLLITNAAGGINYNLKSGDLLLIRGFINLLQQTERGILSAIVQPPKMIKTNLTNLILNKLKTHIKSGIYAANLGPTYETFSEIKLLSSLGASAVGMSTVPEIICANSLGLDYAAISIISNVWGKLHSPSHEQVLKSVSNANDKLETLLLNLLDKI